MFIQSLQVHKNEYTVATHLFPFSGRFSFPRAGGQTLKTLVFISQMQPCPITALLKKFSKGMMFMPNEA